VTAASGSSVALNLAFLGIIDADAAAELSSPPSSETDLDFLGIPDLGVEEDEVAPADDDEGESGVSTVATSLD